MTSYFAKLESRVESFDWSAHRRFLTHERFRPIYDRAFSRLLAELNHEESLRDPQLRTKYLAEFDCWINASHLNQISGLSAFPHRDFIIGVTHALDDLHVVFGECLVVFEKEYAYHRRLKPDIGVRTIETLRRGDVLVLSAPFGYTGDLLENTELILNKCLELAIPVHVDAAWFGCMRGFVFSYDHPAIHSVAFSLSKGLGLGANRVGVRYARSRHRGPVTIINDFSMCLDQSMSTGLAFMRNFEIDYVQKRYADAYRLTCARLDLEPSKALHIAHELRDGIRYPVGVRAFLRFFVDDVNEFKV